MAEAGANQKAYDDLASFFAHVDGRPTDATLRGLRARVLLSLLVDLAWIRELDPSEAAPREVALSAVMPVSDSPTALGERLGALIRDDLIVAGETAENAALAGDVAARIALDDIDGAARLAGGAPVLGPYGRLLTLLCAEHVFVANEGAIPAAEALVACGVVAAVDDAALAESFTESTAVEGSGDDSTLLPDEALALLFDAAARPAPEIAGYVAMVAGLLAHPSSEGPEEAVLGFARDHFAERSEVRAQIAIPESYWDLDPRLDVPVAYMPHDEVASGEAMLAHRVLLIRSDGVSVVPPPSMVVSASDAGVTTRMDESVRSWGTTANPLLRFEGAGALGGGSIVNERVPELTGMFASLEGWIAANMSITAEAHSTGYEERPLSTVIDGGVFVSTVVLLLQTAAEAGYRDVRLHLRDRGGVLRTLPLPLAHDIAGPAHYLVVRTDGYSLVAWDPDALQAPANFSRTSRTCLLDLVGHIEASTAAGTFDPSIPLYIRVDDGSLDFGVLANLASVLSWRRALSEITDDRQLATAPAELLDGVPVPLHAAGLMLKP